MEKKQKRFYKVNEIIWIVGEKKEGKIKSINREKLKVTVEVDGKELELDLWSIDKLKYKAKEEFVKAKKSNKKQDDLFFAKVRTHARIPKKAGEEEAGYDVWSCLEPREIEGKDVFELYLPRFKPTLIPTGIATCVNKKFYLNFSNERGSTGKYGMLVLSGIIDSTYRGEVFVNITPLYKDVLITSEVSDVEETDNLIMYPYSKAICQMIDYRIGESKPSVITYEELKSIPSSRGDGKLGSSCN
jgi:dUTPase